MADNPKPIIVDTSIIFSVMLRGQSRLAEVLLQSDHRLFVCEYVFVELFKHKERIIQAAHLSEDDVLHLLHIIMRRVDIFKEDLIRPENRQKAAILCADVDENDTAHVALTLELDGLLWTGDKKLMNGLARKGFTQFFDPL